MIFTERTITVVNDSATINKPLILYRGDKNIELKITIAESQFKFRNTDASNVIETTDASYAQLVINTPYNSPIFSDVAVTKNGAVIFVITEAMIDEIREVGAYEIQIRLLDDNKQSRASIPPVSNAIEIREPIAIEDGSAVDSNAVNVAKVNRALTTTSAPLEAFDSQGNYIKKTWGDGDPITDAALNKMEAGIDGVNKKVVTKTSQLTNDANYASETFVTNKIAEAQLGGNSQLSEFKNKVANFLGDSQTEANGHKTKIYCEWVKDILGLSTVNNYGISGTTIAKKSSADTTGMCVRYANMSDDADLICVMGGVNDRWFNNELGQFGDTNPLTFYGAMETLCNGLLTKYPGKTIIFITPTEQNHNSCNGANTTGYTATDFANAMKKYVQNILYLCLMRILVVVYTL